MLTDQVAYRRDVVATRDEEIKRRDVIILQLTSRIPEIEAPPNRPKHRRLLGATRTPCSSPHSPRWG
jgi:hypothetical protein